MPSAGDSTIATVMPAHYKTIAYSGRFTLFSKSIKSIDVPAYVRSMHILEATVKLTPIPVGSTESMHQLFMFPITSLVY